jgi:hypothetical protein
VRWVWIVGRWRRVLAFAYQDATGRPAARGGDTPQQAIERPEFVALEAGDRIEALDAAAVARLGLPARPRWLHVVTASHPWRHDPALAGRFHDDFPDDVQVRFYLAPPYGEDMWVSTFGVDLTVGGYVGELLNTPKRDGTGLSPGSVVSYRAARADALPIWVSPAMRADFRAWSSLCPACGFDFVVPAIADVIGPAFAARDQPHVIVGLECVICEGPLVVERR